MSDAPPPKNDKPPQAPPPKDIIPPSANQQMDKIGAVKTEAGATGSKTTTDQGTQKKDKQSTDNKDFQSKEKSNQGQPGIQDKHGGQKENISRSQKEKEKGIVQNTDDNNQKIKGDSNKVKDPTDSFNLKTDNTNLQEQQDQISQQDRMDKMGDKAKSDFHNPFDLKSRKPLTDEEALQQKEKHIRTAIDKDADAILHKHKLMMSGVDGGGGGIENITDEGQFKPLEKINYQEKLSQDQDNAINPVIKLGDITPKTPTDKARVKTEKKGEEEKTIETRKEDSGKKEGHEEKIHKKEKIFMEPAVPDRNEMPDIAHENGDNPINEDRNSPLKGILVGDTSMISAELFVKMVKDKTNNVPEKISKGISFDNKHNRILISPIKGAPDWYKSMVTASESGSWIMTTGNRIDISNGIQNFRADFSEKSVMELESGKLAPLENFEKDIAKVFGNTFPNEKMVTEKKMNRKETPMFQGEGRGVILVINRIDQEGARTKPIDAKEIVHTFFHETALHAGRFSTPGKSPFEDDKEVKKWNNQLIRMFR